jgi:3-oxoacyl-[acyl-carrier protein] reductase
MTGPLTGRTVLITGASRGMGAATARAVHRDGACVVLHYARNVRAAQELAAELGSRVHLVRGDFSAPQQARTTWQAALAEVDRIDVLVNNAGAWLASPLDDERAWDDGWASNLAINLMAPAHLCREAIYHFRESGGGLIVNVASRSAHRGDDAEHLAYGAAKGGLLALTKGIARGYAHEHVLAYAVAPGWVATDLASDSDASSVAAHLPMGEVTPPQEVAEVIAFLATGRARHTTGATIDITGADYVR